MNVSPATDSALYRAMLPRLGERRRERGSRSSFRALRTRSAEWLLAHGLPHPKEEAWRHTPLGRVTDLPFALAADQRDSADVAAVASAQLDTSGVHRIVLAGGRHLMPADALPAGVQILTLSELAQREPDQVLPHLDEGSGPTTAFSALNSVLFDDGLVVRVREGFALERPVQIIVASSAHQQPLVDTPRVLVLAEPGSTLRLIETHVGSGRAPFLSNSVLQVRIAQGAQVEHTRVALGSEHSHRVGLVDVRQARDSRYVSQVVTLGGAFSRLDLRVSFAGEGAEAELGGLYLVRGDERVDYHTVVDHARPRCSSRQSYRGVVDERARAVFDGIVYVRPDAQQTSAHQENRNLLLSDQAVVNTKPHLEIDADDVQCSHGASVGQLDAEQVFYLRSRGIEQSEARAMLADGFAREVVEAIGFEPLRELVHGWARARLPGKGRR